MTRFSIEIKERAIQFRKKGHSLSELALKFKISKSTLSEWMKVVTLSSSALQRLKKKQILGQYKTILLRKKKRLDRNNKIFLKTKTSLHKFRVDKTNVKVLCALLYYCEGVKGTDKLVTFINSDPTLIKLFLFLFRKAFNINESKFRIIMHLHDYHNEKVQKKFWSELTKIPINQFYKTYRKPHSKKRIRNNYPGCVSIRYYDGIIASEILAVYKIVINKFVPI
jgi:transposase-like protein